MHLPYFLFPISAIIKLFLFHRKNVSLQKVKQKETYNYICRTQQKKEKTHNVYLKKMCREKSHPLLHYCKGFKWRVL